MSEPSEFGIGRVIVMSGSHYLLIPVSIRRQFDIRAGDKFAFIGEVGSPDWALKKIKAAKQK